MLLADGTLFRTGLGGVKDTGSWQTYRYGFGPTLDGIFTQSKFGIVTKMGVAFAERAALNVMRLLFDRADKAWMQRVHDCYAELVEAIAAAG